MIIKVIPKKLDKTVTAKDVRSFVGECENNVIAYISCADAFGNRVRITDGKENSYVKEKILAFNAKGTKIKIDNPDLLPAFAMLACYAFSDTEIIVSEGKTEQIVNVITALGVGCAFSGNVLRVNGRGGIKGGVNIKTSDYYSVIAVMLAGTEAEEPLTIQTDRKEINGFIKLFTYLGGNCEVNEQ